MKYFDYKEKKQHGTFDFPIEFYHVTPSHPRYNMPYHWHTECEIIRILEGEFSLIINDENILAKKGDNNCIYECIVFDMKVLLKENHTCTKQIQDIINQKKIIGPILDSNYDELKSCCDGLFKSMKYENVGYEFITQGSLYYLKETILQYKNVLSLIESEYSSTLTLDDLSRAAGMTPKYFCKFFHEMTNKTPIEYLNYYRIESACEQLLTTDYSITEIALNCGFNDSSYFIKTFKKHRGVTPKQYIKQNHYLEK